MKIRKNYPGGNIYVNEIKNNKVKLEQELRDTDVWWFYWNFCVVDAQGMDVIFEFTNGEVLGPWGPAVSRDGVNWKWLGSESLLDMYSFKYKFGEQDEKVYFCFSIPYTLDNFNSFYSSYKNHENLERDVLTISEQGREVPLLRLGNLEADQDIIFACRNHACEASASYLLEGLLKYLMDNRDLNILNKYYIHVVPFLDLDGVENGDQGKCRRPHDHNRDYIVEPIYSSTAALMEYCKKLNIAIGIDFHSPYKWDGRSDYPFFVREEFPIGAEVAKLGRILNMITLENKNTDKIVYNTSHDLEFGQEWNKGGLDTCSSFFVSQGPLLASTFEFPYFGKGDTVFTQDNIRIFGADFAKSLEKYINEYICV